MPALYKGGLRTQRDHPEWGKETYWWVHMPQKKRDKGQKLIWNRAAAQKALYRAYDPLNREEYYTDKGCHHCCGEYGTTPTQVRCPCCRARLVVVGHNSVVKRHETTDEEIAAMKERRRLAAIARRAKKKEKRFNDKMDDKYGANYHYAYYTEKGSEKEQKLLGVDSVAW